VNFGFGKFLIYSFYRLLLLQSTTIFFRKKVARKNKKKFKFLKKIFPPGGTLPPGEKMFSRQCLYRTVFAAKIYIFRRNL